MNESNMFKLQIYRFVGTKRCMSTAISSPTGVGKPHIKAIVCQNKCQRLVWRIQHPCYPILPETKIRSIFVNHQYNPPKRKTFKNTIICRILANHQEPMLQQHWWLIWDLPRLPLWNPLHTKNITILCCYLKENQ